MYWELEEHRSEDEKADYVLLGKPENKSLVDTVATSAPVRALDKFNRSFFDLIVSSTGFVAALSWNDYFKSLFSEGGVFFHSVGKNGFLYIALAVTVLAYVMTVLYTTIYPDRPVATKPNPLERGVKEDNVPQ